VLSSLSSYQALVGEVKGLTRLILCSVPTDINEKQNVNIIVVCLNVVIVTIALLSILLFCVFFILLEKDLYRRLCLTIRNVKEV